MKSVANRLAMSCLAVSWLVASPWPGGSTANADDPAPAARSADAGAAPASEGDTALATTRVPAESGVILWTDSQARANKERARLNQQKGLDHLRAEDRIRPEDRIVVKESKTIRIGDGSISKSKIMVGNREVNTLTVIGGSNNVSQGNNSSACSSIGGIETLNASNECD